MLRRRCGLSLEWVTRVEVPESAKKAMRSWQRGGTTRRAKTGPEQGQHAGGGMMRS
jgi:hypothetical protein